MYQAKTLMLISLKERFDYKLKIIKKKVMSHKKRHVEVAKKLNNLLLEVVCLFVSRYVFYKPTFRTLQFKKIVNLIKMSTFLLNFFWEVYVIDLMLFNIEK